MQNNILKRSKISVIAVIIICQYKYYDQGTYMFQKNTTVWVTCLEKFY